MQEYIVWRVLDVAIDWFILRDEKYWPLQPDADGVIRSETFPGLWLDPAVLLAGELRLVLAVLQQGVASTTH